MPRTAAALIALAAWSGLAIQFDATLATTGSAGQALWVPLRFFTVLTNLTVALTFTASALGRRISPSWLGGVTLAIVLVGVVYMQLLRGLVELSGGALLADAILHKVVPVLVPLYWVALAPKGRLRWRDPAVWALFPLAYLGYALLRGSAEGRYAYPFIDVAKLGAAQVALNAVLIALGFAVAGLALVALDRRLQPDVAADQESDQR
ncbi:Pr6Pr family membrane protein [Sphingomonas sabuli]|uniref:Pr6Pr family membrane protein n=1 Tax=Sphingomonas sabuli TaxID=2764186 RepID=A0A7G9KZX9_9SPHN|nr:Pr6Pr family membrane protein [Sphingomonas sabuli]QNM81928.1 Pr6Pr family membrane protein [Sphingomonas sabuli]